jgi:hypothetical protein
VIVRSRSALLLGLFLAASALASCGSRDPRWDRPVDTSQTPYGLANGVALVDDANHQVVVFTSSADHSLVTQTAPIGHNFASAQPSADGTSLLILSTGDWPLVHASDEPPSLTELTIGTDFKATSTRYTMTQPLANLAVDPLGEYAVAYQGSASSQSFASNPNEIVIFDLTQPPSATNPKARTLQTFGSSPQRLTFSPELMLPAGASAAGVTASMRRLLVVESMIDVTLVDLTNAFMDPHPPDITVRLTDGTSAQTVTPAGIAIDPNPDDGRLALRTLQDSNVYTMQLVPAPPAASVTPGTVENDFTPSLNLTDVGGVPSDITFVNTFDGLRVAALVPSTSQAVLVEPDTSETTAVALSAPFSNLSLVTNIVTPSETGQSSPPADVAMLWQQSSTSGPGTGVALWSLGGAVGQPYRSVEVLSVEDPISSVLDVPNSNLKILTTPAGSTHALYVLDLAARTPSPIDTSSPTPSLSIAPDGGRFWAYVSGGTDLASIDLSTLNPTPLTTTSPIDSVFDIAAPGGARTLLAFDDEGTFGATVFDALHPETATSQRYVALLLEAQ